MITKIRDFISFTGIFLYPIVSCLAWFILENFQKDFAIPVWLRFIVIYIFPALFPIIVLITNIEKKGRGQTDFSFSAVYGLGDKDAKFSKEYLASAYPEVPKEYSSKTPKDFVLGNDKKGKYVICPIGKDGLFATVCGNPGSGKSVLICGILYSMLYREEIAKKGKTKAGKPWNFFMIDLKGELYQRILQIDETDYVAEEYPEVQVIAPDNRRSYGYDVFYRLHKDKVSENDYIKTVNDLAECLVPKTGEDSPFFYLNARKILKGILMYFAKEKYEFIPIIQILMRSNLSELLAKVVADAEQKRMGYVLDCLKGFVGKEGNESVGDIESTLKTHLDVFSLPEIVWCLHNNPNKTSPRVLNNGKTSIDLAISEAMLGPYQIVFRLICMQVLKHCESDFHENDDRYTVIILDEFIRAGYLDQVDNALATLRSKKTSIWMIYQSISQLEAVYGKLSQTLLNLCELKVFLSGSGDKQTIDLVSNMAGEWEATKYSYQRRGIWGGKSNANYSTERRPIVDGKAMMELRKKEEMICVIYGEYFRIKKLKYFLDPYIAPILKKKKEEKTKAKEAG